jgi:hypothetical protein
MSPVLRYDPQSCVLSRTLSNSLFASVLLFLYTLSYHTYTRPFFKCAFTRTWNMPTHTRVRTHSHVSILTYKHAFVHTHVCTHIYTHTHTHTHTHVCTHTYTLSLTSAHTLTDSFTHTYTHLFVYIYIYIYVQTYACTFELTYTRTHTPLPLPHISLFSR